MVLLLSPMDRALTFSLTAKRTGLHLTNPYCKSNWWVVAGDLSGLPDPQDYRGQLDYRDPQEPQVQQDLLERPDLQEPLEQLALRVRPDRRVRQVLLVPLARRASKVPQVLRGQPEPKGQPVIPELLDRL